MDFPVCEVLYLHFSGDAVLLAVLTMTLNVVGLPIDSRVILSDPGDWLVPGDPLL
jgi:hypothetical protein